MMGDKTIVRIAAIGDVHNRWELDDEVALKSLRVDLALFVGDFGNEAVEVVRRIAAIDLPKAVILGNHDAWYSATDWGRQKCPYDRRQEDWVQQQLDLLGESYVGYGGLDFPQLNLSVVGGRPFSWGGSEWRNQHFYRDRFGVHDLAESSDRILAAAAATQQETVLFIGHNGPKGLGAEPEDPCGRDWNPIGGDHGDPDLEQAIVKTRQMGKKIPLVTFGHMHHDLKHTKARLRRAIHYDANGTVYLNAASVPRIRPHGQDDRLCNFSLITLENGVVQEAILVWLNRNCDIVSETLLYHEALGNPALP